jgi:hypothetical protein
MRFFLLVFLCLSLNVQAASVGGVTVDDSVHLGSRNLVLNGAGMRNKFIFSWYVVALYLDARKNTAAAVLADQNEKRIALYMQRDISAGELLYTFNKAIGKNHTDEELKVMKDELHVLEVIFYNTGKIKAGNVILFDYQRGIGTRVTVGGVVRGIIPGAVFNTALLKIWLGEKPVDENLKLKLLGGQ